MRWGVVLVLVAVAVVVVVVVVVKTGAVVESIGDQMQSSTAQDKQIS